jgi:poly-gamma-glutamate synthesis protein (capsule biosynthesis protein)
MDRDIGGLRATLDTVERVGLDAIGTYASEAAREATFIRNIGGIRVGFVAYTYGTNAFAHHLFLSEDVPWAVNLYQPQETLDGAIDLLDDDGVPLAVYRLYDTPNETFDTRNRPLLERMAADIQRTRAHGAQYIVFLLHSGGQYNPWPDALTLRVTRLIREAGADAIVANHPHIIHPIRQEDDCLVAYSLGNFVFTPEQEARGGDLAGEYSAVLGLHLELDDDRVAPAQVTFTLHKSVTAADGRTAAWPVHDLLRRSTDPAEREQLRKDTAFCVNKLTNRPLDTPVEPQEEYVWSEP